MAQLLCSPRGRGTGRSPACQCAISRHALITLTRYKSGAIAHWRVVGSKVKQPFLPQRGAITDLSKRARIRCAWALGNAPRDWGAMAVLTFRETPVDPKLALKRFVRKFRMWFGDRWQWAWVMEFQTRGAVHFHLFFERRLINHYPHTVETVTRHGKTTELIRGGLETFIVDMWIRSVGDNHPDFLAFQRGGIIENLRSPDAAARYVAKEAGKRAQKVLPEHLEGAGRWWWLSPAGKPRRVRTIRLKKWPFQRPYRLIFDADALENPRFPPKHHSFVRVTAAVS